MLSYGTLVHCSCLCVHHDHHDGWNGAFGNDLINDWLILRSIHLFLLACELVLCFLRRFQKPIARAKSLNRFWRSLGHTHTRRNAINITNHIDTEITKRWNYWIFPSSSWHHVYALRKVTPSLQAGRCRRTSSKEQQTSTMPNKSSTWPLPMNGRVL